MLGGTAPFTPGSGAGLGVHQSPMTLAAPTPLPPPALPPRPLVFGAQYAPLSGPLGAASALSLAGLGLGGSGAGSGLGGVGGGGGDGSAAAFWARYLRRGLSPAQWDVDYICWQLVHACRAPALVAKLTLHRKQTKNTWARDDPALALVELALLAVVALAYGAAYRLIASPLALLWLICQFWAAFVGGGVLAATASWAAANRYCRAGASLPHSVEQSVDWLFAWDVHCNAFVPVLLLVYIANFLLLPLTLAGDGLVPCLVGNALYTAAAGHYLYITFQGYVVLPFLQHDKLRPLLAGIVAAAVLGVGATLLRFNIAAFMLGFSIA